MSFPFGEQVTVHRVTDRSRDADGNSVPVFEDEEHGPVSVAPRFSQEFDTGAKDTTLIGFSVTFKPPIELGSQDEMTVRGRRCRVDGEPMQYQNPFTSTRMTRAVLRFVKG